MVLLVCGFVCGFMDKHQQLGVRDVGGGGESEAEYVSCARSSCHLSPASQPHSHKRRWEASGYKAEVWALPSVSRDASC